MLIFGLHSTSDDRPGWLIDLNPIYHLSPATKMKCSFLDYVQLLMISWIGQWTWTPSTTSLQPKTWNACFWITFNFWWSARLVDGLEPHLQPLSSQKKIKCSFLGYVQLLMISQAGQLTQTPSTTLRHPKKMKCPFLDYIQILMISQVGPWTRTASATHLQPKKWNAHFWNMFNFQWSARLVDGLKPHLPRLSSQKNEIPIFGIRSTPDDRPGWSMDLNPIYHLSPATKMKSSFLDYLQLLMIGLAGRCTWTPSTTSLQPQKWNAHFWITFNFWWLAGLVDGLEPCVPSLCSQKNEMLIFGLRSTSDDQPGWSMDSNPICHLSPAKKMKCSFLDYIQLLMISWIGQWTRMPSTTLLQPKKIKCSF